MNYTQLRADAQKLIDRYNEYMAETEKLTDEEREKLGPAPFDSGSLVNAERVLFLCDEVFPKISAEDLARIDAIPAYQKDLRSVKDIKDRYGLSWTELGWLRWPKMSNLSRARSAAGMTQAALAERSGVNLRTLQDYEQGRKSINGAAAVTVYRIAHALGVSVEDLLENE